MESACLSAVRLSSPPYASVFSPGRKIARSPTIMFMASKDQENGSNLNVRDSQYTGIVPFADDRISLSPLSEETAMNLVLSAAAARGWTTGSGMEGPSVPAAADTSSVTEQVSTFPWSLFTRSPRRRMRVAFTCNVCGQRTTRAINPHAYTDGTVFVQCCGCKAFHKLVDNLNLFHDMKCYVNPSFLCRDQQRDLPVKFFDDDGQDLFPPI